MSGNVTLIAGSTQTFPATFTQTPSGTPTVTIYTDQARTTVAVATANMTATGNPNVWLATVPGSLGVGIYFLKFAYNSTTDSNDTLTLVTSSVNLGGTLARVSDVRTVQSDTTTNPLARLWTGLSDAQLLALLERASGTVESIVGGRLMGFTVTEDLPCSLDPDLPAGVGLALTLPTLPGQNHDAWTTTVTAVAVLDPYASAVSYVTIGTTVTFDTSTGRVRFDASSFPDARTARVTYTGGFNPVPPELIEATILFAGDAWLVGTDARNGQMDAADLYARAMTRLGRWKSSLTSLGFA